MNPPITRGLSEHLLSENMNQVTISVTCLVLIDQGKSIFITQRALDKTLGGLWEFPGGKIEVNESPETALRRELQEELKLNVGHLQSMELVYHDYDFGRIQLQPFLARCNNRPPVELLEHSAFDWATLAELQSYALAPADIPILDQITLILDGTS